MEVRSINDIEATSVELPSTKFILDSEVSDLSVASLKDYGRVVAEVRKALQTYGVPSVDRELNWLIGNKRLGLRGTVVVVKTLSVSSADGNIQTSNGGLEPRVAHAWKSLEEGLKSIYSPDGEEAEVEREKRKLREQQILSAHQIRRAEHQFAEEKRKKAISDANAQVLSQCPAARAALTMALNAPDEATRKQWSEFTRILRHEESAGSIIAPLSDDACEILGLEVFTPTLFE